MIDGDCDVCRTSSASFFHYDTTDTDEPASCIWQLYVHVIYSYGVVPKMLTQWLKSGWSSLKEFCCIWIHAWGMRKYQQRTSSEFFNVPFTSQVIGTIYVYVSLFIHIDTYIHQITYNLDIFGLYKYANIVAWKKKITSGSPTFHVPPASPKAPRKSPARAAVSETPSNTGQWQSWPDGFPKTDFIANKTWLWCMLLLMFLFSILIGGNSKEQMT